MGKKRITVQQFIENVLGKSQESGNIRIADGPGIWFRNGKATISDRMEQYLDRKVKSVSSAGEQEHMAYVLMV